MILIKNAKIYTMQEEVIENGSILIKEGKIKEIIKKEAYSKGIDDLDGVEIIDANDCIVMPGIIDAHCHLGMIEDGMGFEGDDTNEMSDPVTPELRAIDGINPMDRGFEEAYQNGITTVATGPGSSNVICGQFAAIKTYGKRIDDMIIKEPVAMKVALGENPKTIYGKEKRYPMTRMATAAILRETLFKAREYMNSEKPNFDMKMEAMAKVLTKEIPLKVHAHRTDDIFTALRIAKEFDVEITLDHCTEGHLISEYIKQEGKYAIVGPSLSDRSKIELRNLTFETPGVLHNAGVKIAIMTDSPETPVYYLPLCAGLAVKSGLDEMEALKAITINPAEILGIDERVGSIEVGKDADIVIFDGHPLRDIMCKVLMTIIDGKIVYNQIDG
ncbi:amidohydrolase [Gottschalkia acidurici 9a]|uniref:Amidohydrolase n=1 Tax=Gottschalkia acidurici (strain ATCC 7906 / DSM 604 / BCRC 14475 / CIP 104303 / KCTC 5404 / NCIMB 10678 / 9a) TaxID=1128398 RepID=K0AX73_GOTA9|nr:amidohydrolase [Gottschalkia acidurici]AFS77345.1 amidohydrolase [Gottschalkia acidurici 9a]